MLSFRPLNGVFLADCLKEFEMPARGVFQSGTGFAKMERLEKEKDFRFPLISMVGCSKTNIYHETMGAMGSQSKSVVIVIQ